MPGEKRTCGHPGGVPYWRGAPVAPHYVWRAIPMERPLLVPEIGQSLLLARARLKHGLRSARSVYGPW